MKTSIWNKGRRAGAGMLAVTLLLGVMPQIRMEVRAETDGSPDAENSLDDYTFSVSAGKIYDGTAVTVDDLLKDISFLITAEKDGETEVVLHPGADCDITPKTLGEWKDAGTYTLAVTPREGSGYTFSEQEAAYQIEPFALTDTSVSLSEDTVWWTSDVILEEQWPAVTVKNGDFVIPSEDYQTQIEREVQDTGVYTIIIEPAEGSLNLTGSAAKQFEVKYDEKISDESYSFGEENSCVENNSVYYYRDASKVVFYPADGYLILENGISGGVYQNGTVVLSEGAQEVTFRIRKSGGTGREITVSGFAQDTEGPYLSFVPESVYTDADGNVWSEGMPELTAEDVGAGLRNPDYFEYRMEGESGWRALQESAGENLEDGQTYQFRTLDRLGNPTEEQKIIACTIDKNAPEITVSSCGEEIIFDENQTVEFYLKKSGLSPDGTKTFLAEISDTGSGIGRQTVRVNGQEVSGMPSEITWSPSNLQAAESAEITMEAEDGIGHVSKRQIFIYYDPAAPQISNLRLNGQEQESILSKENITVTAAVRDDLLNGDEQLVSVKCVNTKNPEESIPMKRQEGSDTYQCQITTEDFLEETYQILAEDKAGNLGKSPVISVSIAKSAPSAIGVTMDKIPNESGWINEDAEFTILVSESKKQPRNILYFMQYQKVEMGGKVSEEDADWNWIIKDGEKAEKEDTDEAGIYAFHFRESDETFEGQYAFRVKDEAGNVSAYVCAYIKKDKIFPETEPGDILVQYASETGRENESHSFLDGLKHFFGRAKVQVYLYIPQDRISGIKSIEYMYDKGVGGAEVNEGQEAVIGGRTYAEFELLLTQSAADRLKITDITDYAGNSLKQMLDAVPAAEGGTILVIDGTAPELTVDYKDTDSRWEDKKGSDTDKEGRERKYYARADKSYKEIELTYQERFFMENTDGASDQVIKPVIKINGETVTENSDLVEWGVYDENLQEIKALLKLPYQENREIEYVIETSYQDGSENLLALSDAFWQAGAEDGGYVSGTIVLDDKAPELVSCGMKETPMEDTAGGVTVYPNKDGDDVTVLFTVEETAGYWHKENLQFIIRDMTHDTVIVEADGGELEGWEENGKLHMASFAFDGEANAAANYRVEIFYKDMAGNAMTGEEIFGIKDGRYISGEFILDHTAPVFGISYNAAYRLVKNSDTAAERDWKGMPPQTGYTAYYQNDIAASFCIQEAYAHPVEENGRITSLAGFDLTVNGKAEDVPDIKWSYNEAMQLYTGTFTLREEGRYQIGIRYHDVAGNVFVPGGTVQGAADAALTDGLYRSETLVVDKTAPMVTASYTNPMGNRIEPVYQKDGRNYFNQSAYLKIEVKESNLRNFELKESLRKLSAYTRKQPEKQMNTMAKKFISQIEEKTVADSAVWNIPLTTEANYDIPIAFEDLAGNQAKAVTEYSCVDTGNPVNLKFTYSVEKSGYKDVIHYKNFGYAFADQKLTVTASAEDTVSGIWRMEFTVTDETGEKQVITKEYDPSADKKAGIALPLSGKNFKGSVSVKVTDYSKNESRREQGCYYD